MPNIKIDSSLNEFEFTVQEALGARTLTPLQIQWLQTKYAIAFKEKASILIPEDKELTMSFITKVCEIEGKLNFIQELFSDHANVLKELADPSKAEQLQQAGNERVDTLASRASNLVNQNNGDK